MNTQLSPVPNVVCAATTSLPAPSRHSSQRTVKPSPPGKKLTLDRYETEQFTVLILHRCSSSVRLGTIDLLGLGLV